LKPGNPKGAGTFSEDTKGSYPGVGVECQGFAQRKSSNRDDAWIDDCNAGRNPFVAGNPDGAGTYEAGQKGSYPGVGVECQGFAQKKSGHRDDAWIDDCQTGRNPFVAGNPNGAGTWADEKTHGSYPGVGVECQGFAQKKKQSLAQDDAWIDDCNADRNPFVAGNPNGAGTHEDEHKGSYPGVGVECQGFAQKRSVSLAQQKDDAWVDDCSPDRTMTGAYGSGTQGAPGAEANGSFKGVGVECQGFAQTSN